jgi:protein TonB
MGVSDMRGRSAGSTGEGTGISTGAHAAYGQTPAPDYPDEARTLGEQGTVMLRVTVGADGTVRQVTLEKSSGFQDLDDAAEETVRDEWRFVPAIRNGSAIDSWVLVPIRFTLKEASAD